MLVPNNINSDVMNAIKLFNSNSKKDIVKAKKIIERVLSEYSFDFYPSYSAGLAGIGCGLQYLIYMDYLDKEASEILEFIDHSLSINVSYSMQNDFSHATGLTGIATYYFSRLESNDICMSEIQRLKCKFVLLTIFEIIAAKCKLNGFTYPLPHELSSITEQEQTDVNQFLLNCISHNICNELSKRILMGIKDENHLTLNCNQNNDDLSDLTISIVVRIDSKERLCNLYSVVNFYYSNTNAHISILEVDTIQRVNITCNDRIFYLFQYDTLSVFHFTHYRNELIKLSKTSIVAIWDTDIIVPLNQLYQSVYDIRSQKSVYSTPYNGICYDVPDDISLTFKNDLTIDILFNNKEKMNYFYGRLSVGGVYVVEKEEYIRLGLENENFIGWGPEDIERIQRITILNKSISRINGYIYHLSHPRSQNSNYASDWTFVKSYQELFKICSLSSNDLLEYINTWEWK